MTIKDMQYDFKFKFNKIDSQQNRSFLTPEVDWLLNEAKEIFVKGIVVPKTLESYNFKFSQRSLNDIKPLITEGNLLSPGGFLDIIEGVVDLPENYWYYQKGRILTEKEGTESTAELFIRDYKDSFEEDIFTNSSFEWKEINGILIGNSIKTYTDGTFTNKKLSLTYIKKLTYMHSAGSFRNGSYNLPSGEVLTGYVDCELDSHTHREIVDIAVFLASNISQEEDYKTSLDKIKYINQ